MGRQGDSMKMCSKCGVEKSDTDFYNNRRSCKQCVSEMYRVWYNTRSDAAIFRDIRKKEAGLLKVDQEEKYMIMVIESSPEYIKEKCQQEIYNYRKQFNEKLDDRSFTCCKILKEHHDVLKEDPEHLTTEFIKKMSGCKCKVNIEEEV